MRVHDEDQNYTLLLQQLSMPPSELRRLRHRELNCFESGIAITNLPEPRSLFPILYIDDKDLVFHGRPLCSWYEEARQRSVQRVVQKRRREPRCLFKRTPVEWYVTCCNGDQLSYNL